MFDDPTLIDPDVDTNVKYGWDTEFQRHIASLIVSDRQFLLQSFDLIKPTYFTDKAHSKVVEIVREFFDKYRILPRKDFIVQELKSQLSDNKSLPYYLAEVNVLFEYFQPGMEAREYLRDKIVYFAKIQSIKDAFQKSLELIDKNPESEDTWDKVYNKMRSAMTTHQNFEIGLDYLKSVKDRYAKKEEETDLREKFVTGFESIDKEISGGGYNVGEIISIVGASGSGKSLLLAGLTATNLLRGKRCLYITLELAEDKVADRLDAILTGFPIQSLCSYKDQIFEKLSNLKGVSYEDSIYPVIIKQFPAGTASVNTIRAYISQLRFHEFDPEFVVVDYVGEMSLHPDMKTHESREMIVRELRAMASEEKVFIATAMQPNREAKIDQRQKGERGRIDDDHLADSYGQIRPLDGCISLNQNDTEKTLGIGRAYVIKQRDGKSRYQFWLSFNRENLKITEITQNEYLEVMNKHKEFVTDDVKIDMITKKGWKPTEE